MLCPRCADPLRRSETRYGHAYSCPRCRGFAMTMVVARRAVGKRAREVWAAATVAGESRLPCPSCRKPASAVRLSADAGDLELDVCRRSCQLVWFDLVELKRLAGGALRTDPDSSVRAALAVPPANRPVVTLGSSDERSEIGPLDCDPSDLLFEDAAVLFARGIGTFLGDLGSSFGFGSRGRDR